MRDILHIDLFLTGLNILLSCDFTKISDLTASESNETLVFLG